VARIAVPVVQEQRRLHLGAGGGGLKLLEGAPLATRSASGWSPACIAATRKDNFRKQHILRVAGTFRISANSPKQNNLAVVCTPTKFARATMVIQKATGARSAHVIVVGNEKGGSGKSTVAMHIAIALLKARQRVATIDLDARQKSFTNYIENRRAWAEHVARDLEIPKHVCLDETVNFPATENRAAGCKALTDAVDALADSCNFIVIDTPGHDSYLTRLAHAMADTLITPLNDSFVDFDVLGTVDPATFAVTGTSHYAQLVEEARSQRQLLDHVTTDWIVLRNRLSTLGSRNKRLVAEGLQELSQRLNFRCIEGLAERVIFREFYPRGLTALDDLDETTLGTRPTMSHVTARFEIENLLRTMGLFDSAASQETLGDNRDAA
jgi:chromosome partitioning protein